METDVLTKDKKRKNKDKPKERAPDKSSMKCFLCKERGEARKDCPKFSTACRKENSETRAECERH